MSSYRLKVSKDIHDIYIYIDIDMWPASTSS